MNVMHSCGMEWKIGFPQLAEDGYGRRFSFALPEHIFTYYKLIVARLSMM